MNRLSTPNRAAIPAQLKALPQWVCWRLVEADGRTTKWPVEAKSGRRIDVTSPTNWLPYDAACAAADANPDVEGVGFCFSSHDPFCGIDLDDCLDAAGNIAPWAQSILAKFDTYYEVSPSGTGIKLWAMGRNPSPTGRRVKHESGEVELYDHARFFTVTGWVHPDANPTIQPCQPQIDALYATVFAEKPRPAPTATAAMPAPATRRTDISDIEIISRLMSEKDGLGRRLFHGETQDYAGDDSRADGALCAKLAWYTGNDPPRIDRIFRCSKLYREKWEREDYRNATIQGAIGCVKGRFERSAETPPPSCLSKTRIIAPTASNGLGKNIQDVIDGTRQNIPFMWRVLTGQARALLPGSLTVLCGSGGSTKSMMMSQCCIDWLDQQVPFACFHLEEDREFHLLRALAQLAGNSGLTLDDWVRDHPGETLDAYDQFKERIDQIGQHIWDAPANEVTLSDLADWTRDRCKEKRRVVVIDPVTAADPGGDQWTVDRKFVGNVKTILRDYSASAIVVTHPRGVVKGGDRLDQIAGGRAYNRFTSCVLWLESIDPSEIQVQNWAGRFVLPTNRIMTILKARNGPGNGLRIAYYFDPKTLRFKEQGYIVDEG